jgi:uncharacterized protein (TIGR02186 family)
MLVTMLSCPAPGLAAAPGPNDAVAQREAIEADVSVRSVKIGTAYSGTKVVMFGTIVGAKADAKPPHGYDIIAVINGPPEELVARRKSYVAGLWINVRAYDFKNVPSYYTVLSTRPVKEIAARPILYQLGIGAENIRIVSAAAQEAKEAIDFREAVVRVKTHDGLYREDPAGVEFIGTSLFRGSVDLPANAPVGKFTAFIYLFRDGELLATYKSQLDLQREGFEQAIFSFSQIHPFFYGLASVALALSAGFAATMLFQRNR